MESFEQWRPVPNSDVYEVSNLGRIRTNGRYVNTCYGAKRFVKAKILNLTGGKRRYIRISKNVNGTQFVHRLVAMAWIPNPDNLPFINHIDGNPRNNRIENLEWCTHLHNMRHSYEIGLSKVRELKPCENSIAAKLTNSQVAEIKQRILRGERNCNIAREFGVVPGTIGEIKAGRSWKEIPWMAA